MRPTIRLHYLALAAVLAGVRVALPAEPNIELEKNSWDFGEVTQGRQLSHTLAVYNRGDAALVIGSVRTSCSVCSGAMVDAKVIPPGARAKLNIRFYTARASGMQHKSIVIFSNDPDEPFVRVSITGTVVKRKRPAIALKPEVLEVGLAALGETREGAIQVRNSGNAPLEIQGIQCSTGCSVVARPVKPIPPGGSDDVRLALSVGNRKGLIDGYIHVQSNDPATPTLVVPITGYAAALGSVHAPGHRLTFTPVEFAPIVPGKGRLVTKYRVANDLACAAKVEALAAAGGPVVAPQSFTVPANGTAEFTIELPDDFSFERQGQQPAFTVHLPILVPRR